jgi:hypothetical protein
VRDGAGQASYLRELLEVFDTEGVDTAFVFAFALYGYPHRPGRLLRAAPGIKPPDLLVRLDRFPALRAQEWAALGDGPPDGVDDEREPHLGDFPGGFDRSVGGAPPVLGLDLLGHGLPPCERGFTGRSAAS